MADKEIVQYIKCYYDNVGHGKWDLSNLDQCVKFMDQDLKHFLSVCDAYVRPFFGADDVDILTMAQELLESIPIVDYTIIDILCTNVINSGNFYLGLNSHVNDLMISRWVFNSTSICRLTNILSSIFVEIKYEIPRWGFYLSILISQFKKRASCVNDHVPFMTCDNCLVLRYVSKDARSVCFKNQKSIADAYVPYSFTKSLQEYYDEVAAGHVMFRKLDALPAELIEYIIDFTKFDCDALR